MITLIANTGIQYFSTDIPEFKTTVGKIDFHEWFDTTVNQRKLEIAHYFKEDDVYVKKRDLFTNGFMENDGTIPSGLTYDNALNINSEKVPALDRDNCYSISNIGQCSLDKLFNKWLPIPIFEENTRGNSKFGPTNWSRLKVIPFSGEDGKQRLRIVMAFDTTTIYDNNTSFEDRLNEMPHFRDDFVESKKYSICNDTFKLIDFVSQIHDCSWVDNCIRSLLHGTQNVNGFKYLSKYIFFMHYLQQIEVLPKVTLYKGKNTLFSNVSLVIDIGNSRTSVLLLENNDFTKVRTLELQDFTDPWKKYNDSFDMRLAFRKADFGNFGIINSTQFTYPSIMRLGVEAEKLTYSAVNENVNIEKFSTYSSPKRYLWDTKPSKREWEYVQLGGEDKEPIWIKGITNQLNSDGTINMDGQGGERSLYSRQALMKFAFLEILAQAKMQMNSHQYRDEVGGLDTPRKLDKIIITCPTAMSKVEQIALRKAAEEAAIVLMKHLINENSVELSYRELASRVNIIPSASDLRSINEQKIWNYDEATCSQFVFLFAEISKRYLNNHKKYFDLYGKSRNDLGTYTQKAITIGSVDIGAGTTDLMICAHKYNQSGNNDITTTPLFYESFYFAGDDLLMELVRQLIIEGQHAAIENKLRNVGCENISAALNKFFGRDNALMTYRARQYRRDFNLQVSVPIVLKYLELLQQEPNCQDYSIDTLLNKNKPNSTLLNYFAEHFGFRLEETQFTFNPAVINQIIERTFEPLLKKISAICSSYSCDFVLLAGKPTSLKSIENLFLKFYPVSPNRLITFNNYRVGRWYPFQDGNGYFDLSKKSNVTVGAMIAKLASEGGGLNGFRLNLQELGNRMEPTTDFIGGFNAYTKNIDEIILSPDKNTETISISILSYKLACKQINRKGYPSRVLYALEVDEHYIEQKILTQGELDRGIVQDKLKKEVERIINSTPLRLTIERPDYLSDRETLVLTEILNKQGESLNTKLFDFHIQSLSEPENFWLDTGGFILSI